MHTSVLVFLTTCYCNLLCVTISNYSGPPLYCPSLYRHPRLSPNCKKKKDPLMLIPPYNATPICRYISEILPIQRKALNNQSINQCHPRISPSATGFKKI